MPERTNREFVMLAKRYEMRLFHQSFAWYLSEKLDGMRCLWDGGRTRGIPKKDVWWANQDKDERFVTEPICTGLWSRYGNIIHAPDWWLDELPEGTMLDGELWTDREEFQSIVSIVKSFHDDKGWDRVTYQVFDMPSWSAFMMSGKINTPHFQKVFPREQYHEYPLQFHLTIPKLIDLENEIVRFVGQTKITTIQEVHRLFGEYTEKGAEGVMLRRSLSCWMPYRTSDLLKLTPLNDDEGEVTGYFAGEEGKGGKLLGMLGAVEVQWKGLTFKVSGFTDSERMLNASLSTWARGNPGQRLPDSVSLPQFPIGELITFKFRELNDSGIPKSARYHRRKEKS